MGHYGGNMETFELLILALTLLWSGGVGVEKILRCTQITKMASPKFHLVQPCSFSRMVLVGLTRASSIERCAAFAHKKQGLAFNYNQVINDMNMASNCLILDCPEYDHLLSLQPHSSFDYYSLYSKPIPEENTTCLPGVGMFYLHKARVNFSEATELCEGKGGKLANVVSESRTNGLSRWVATLGSKNTLRMAYVGLNDLKMEGEFVSFKNQPLKCFSYRAWAPSEPRSRKSREDCVVLDSRNSWRVVDCASKHPFLCELNPSGPPADDTHLCYRIAETKTKAMCLARANYSEFQSAVEDLNRCEQLEAIGMANLNKTLAMASNASSMGMNEGSNG